LVAIIYIGLEIFLKTLKLTYLPLLCWQMFGLFCGYYNYKRHSNVGEERMMMITNKVGIVNQQIK